MKYFFGTMAIMNAYGALFANAFMHTPNDYGGYLVAIVLALLAIASEMGESK